MTRKTDENYLDLANAIIEQGIKDLVRAYRKLNRANSMYKRKTATNEIKYIEKQLRSEWCRFLTNLDIEFLIEGAKTRWKRKDI